MGKKRNKKRVQAHKNNSSETKMSAMIIEYASDYIKLGDTLEEKQSYLNAACSAWNIAILKKEERKKALDNFIEQYKRINPDADDTDMDNARHDMELLIKEKIRLYPNVKRTIAGAEITNDKGKERIVVASINPRVK
jgi:hypothetical protein